MPYNLLLMKLPHSNGRGGISRLGRGTYMVVLGGGVSTITKTFNSS